MTDDSFSKVMTKYGPAIQLTRFAGAENEVLVCFYKSDFKDRLEEWERISPHNGPCVYKILDESEVKNVNITPE